MDSQCRVLPALSGSGVGGGEVLGKVCLVIWSCMLQLLGAEKQSADSLEVRLAAGAGLFCRPQCSAALASSQSVWRTPQPAFLN